MIRRRTVKQPNSQLLGKSKMMLGKQTANGAAVGMRIFVLHESMVQKLSAS
jgi:hypothetical protein